MRLAEVGAAMKGGEPGSSGRFLAGVCRTAAYGLAAVGFHQLAATTRFQSLVNPLFGQFGIASFSSMAPLAFTGATILGTEGFVSWGSETIAKEKAAAAAGGGEALAALKALANDQNLPVDQLQALIQGRISDEGETRQLAMLALLAEAYATNLGDDAVAIDYIDAIRAKAGTEATEDLREQLAAATGEVERLGNELKAAKQEAGEEAKGLQEQLEQANGYVERLGKELEAAKKEAGEQAKGLSEQLEKANGNVERLGKELEAAKKEAGEQAKGLSEQLEKANGNVARLGKELAEAKKLEGQLTTAQGRVEKLGQELQAAQGLVDGFVEQVEILATKLSKSPDKVKFDADDALQSLTDTVSNVGQKKE